MGTVYLVLDRHLSRNVALKVMRPELACNAEDAASFIAEARAVSQLEHSHIVPLYDMGRSSGDDLYYTMQYVKGEPLRTTIRHLRGGDVETHRRWPFQKRAQALVDLCHALAFAHQRGVLHRDVKPANILVTDKGELVLTDWGISVRYNSSTEPPGTTDGFVGTAGYVAPEALLHGTYSAQSEVFSFGIVMYQLLCFTHPFETEAQTDRNEATLAQTAVAPDTHVVPVQGRVPRELAYICMRCLDKEPKSRYGSMEEVATALELYLHGLAPVVCVQTGLKRALYGLIRLADDRGTVLIVGLCLVVVVPLASVLAWWITVGRH
jgi:serine/threonine protein kinase